MTMTTNDACIHVWPSHLERVWINRVRLPILPGISLTGKTNISLSPFAPENVVSRYGLGSPVPRQPAHLHTHAIGTSAFVLVVECHHDMYACVYVYGHQPGMVANSPARGQLNNGKMIGSSVLL